MLVDMAYSRVSCTEHENKSCPYADARGIKVCCGAKFSPWYIYCNEDGTIIANSCGPQLQCFEYNNGDRILDYCDSIRVRDIFALLTIKIAA